jgi:hypothetical protein
MEVLQVASLEEVGESAAAEEEIRNLLLLALTEMEVLEEVAEEEQMVHQRVLEATEQQEGEEL